MRLSASEFFRDEAQSVAVEPRTPQSRFPLHDHEFNELVVVVSGNGWHVLNEEPRLITHGEVLYIQAEDHHAFEEVHDLFLTNILYRPNGRLLRPEHLRQLNLADQDSGRRHWQLTEEGLGELKPLLDRLDREVQSSDPLAQAMAESLFVQLSVTICRNRFAPDGELLPETTRLAHVLTFLRHNCTSPVDLDEVAHRFGYSPRNFVRVFRAATATTPHNYLVKLRLSHAMRTLRNSDDSITEVAFASGFNDSNYFSNMFSKMTGLSPSEYRRQSRLRES